MRLLQHLDTSSSDGMDSRSRSSSPSSTEIASHSIGADSEWIAVSEPSQCALDDFLYLRIRSVHSIQDTFISGIQIRR
jgi:hypothetical protein